MKKNPTSPYLNGASTSGLGTSPPGAPKTRTSVTDSDSLDSESANNRSRCALRACGLSLSRCISRPVLRTAIQTKVFKFQHRPERYLGEANRLRKLINPCHRDVSEKLRASSDVRNVVRL